ncbi:MAG: hypothetical protein NTV86_00980 [Planctomycetota bacterium]|nr:hypothetical protein [Planctomycetota bacterium]
MTRTAVRPRCEASQASQTVSLKTLAQILDTGRSSARRWLKQAGIRPIAMNDGPKSAIRYRWKDVEGWLHSRQYVD